MISLVFVFEPYRVRSEDLQDSFNVEEGNLYFIRNEDGTYDLYQGAEYMATLEEIFDNNIPVYSSSPY